MKKAYSFLLVALSIVVLSWFLPWMYSILFPVSLSDPFIAYSPVSDQLIITERMDEKEPLIFALDADGNRVDDTNFTKEQRDSLLPQIYYTQLIAREQLPDTINGIEITIPVLKHNQWVFNSLPRDINKCMADVYLIMESMPARIDLEDPKEVFRFRDGKVEFIDMATNKVIPGRSKRFTEVFDDRGFTLPMKSYAANITSRKPYDEGYLMVDANGDIFHMKMQAGRPYMSKIRKPDSICAAHVFIMENVDTRFLGFMSDENKNLYVIEREGYKLSKLPVGKVDPEKDKLSIVKNLFNMVVKVSNPDGSRWVALDSETYSPLSHYAKRRELSLIEKMSYYIFPFSISFTSTSDCYAVPRIENISWSALFLNVVLALIVAVVYRRRRHEAICNPFVAFVVTVVLGVFAIIPFLVIKN